MGEGKGAMAARGVTEGRLGGALFRHARTFGRFFKIVRARILEAFCLCKFAVCRDDAEFTALTREDIIAVGLCE